MIFVAMADGVVKMEFAVRVDDGGRPEVISQPGIGPEHRAAGETPLEEIVRLEHGENFADSLALGLEFARADGIIDVLKFPNERIGEIAGVNRVGVGLFCSDRSHTANSTASVSTQLGQSPHSRLAVAGLRQGFGQLRAELLCALLVQVRGVFESLIIFHPIARAEIDGTILLRERL
jgi:hypothetical protein